MCSDQVAPKSPPRVQNRGPPNSKAPGVAHVHQAEQFRKTTCCHVWRPVSTPFFGSPSKSSFLGAWKGATMAGLPCEVSVFIQGLVSWPQVWLQQADWKHDVFLRDVKRETTQFDHGPQSVYRPQVAAATSPPSQTHWYFRCPTWRGHVYTSTGSWVTQVGDQVTRAKA